MTRDEFTSRFPHASEACIRANCSDAVRRAPGPPTVRREPSRAQPQQTVFDAALGPAQGKAGYSGRVRIRIKSFRRFLLDPDNLAGGCKYFVDCCRYSGLVRGDSPADIEFAATQEKVRSKKEERTEIVIERLTPSLSDSSAAGGS
jgi:hypothetical protein